MAINIRSIKQDRWGLGSNGQETISVEHNHQHYTITTEYDIIKDAYRYRVIDESDNISLQYVDGYRMKRAFNNQGQLIEYVIAGHNDQISSAPEYRYSKDAPTNEELAKYPALKEAWQEYLLIRKLTCTQIDKDQ